MGFVLLLLEYAMKLSFCMFGVWDELGCSTGTELSWGPVTSACFAYDCHTSGIMYMYYDPFYLSLEYEYDCTKLFL